jgi:hypothetical protein
MNIFKGDIIAKVGREDIFKPTVGSESLHEISNKNEVRLVNFATSKSLIVKSTMFPHRKIDKFTSASPDGKTHNRLDLIAILGRRHSSVLEVQPFGGADCVTDHNLVVVKVRERLAVINGAMQQFDMERFSLINLNEVEGKK